jgi:hypothetical protein
MAVTATGGRPPVAKPLRRTVTMGLHRLTRCEVVEGRESCARSVRSRGHAAGFSLEDAFVICVMLRADLLTVSAGEKRGEVDDVAAYPVPPGCDEDGAVWAARVRGASKG